MGSNEKRRKRNIRQAFLVTAFMLLCAFGVWQFFKMHGEADLLSLRFRNPAGQLTAEVKLEVASTNPERQKGLMYRKELEDRRGMIFVFAEEKIQTLWMRNTYVPLDMIFLDSKLKVVGILKDVPILNETRRSVALPSTYVVELPAGTAAKLQIADGAQAVFEGVLPRGS